MAATVDILVNGKPVSIADGSSLTGLIDTLNLRDGKVAIELNKEIVPRSEHGSRLLAAGDEVEIVQAIGGG